MKKGLTKIKKGADFFTGIKIKGTPYQKKQIKKILRTKKITSKLLTRHFITSIKYVKAKESFVAQVLPMNNSFILEISSKITRAILYHELGHIIYSFADKSEWENILDMNPEFLRKWLKNYGYNKKEKLDETFAETFSRIKIGKEIKGIATEYVKQIYNIFLNIVV